MSKKSDNIDEMSVLRCSIVFFELEKSIRQMYFCGMIYMYFVRGNILRCFLNLKNMPKIYSLKYTKIKSTV